jgi:hypothetical protein
LAQAQTDAGVAEGFRPVTRPIVGHDVY